MHENIEFPHKSGLPVKTAPIENGLSPKQPHFRSKRPQTKNKSVKTAP